MANYILYTDKNENFKCDISLEGAKLKDTFARLVLNTDDVNVIFEGKIESGGKCVIPIKPLKHIFDVSTNGEMVLEVVADDTYFIPWKSTFTTKKSKSVEVKVSESVEESKPKLTVEVNTPKQMTTIKSKPKQITQIYSLKVPVKEISKVLIEYGVNIKNLNKKKTFTKEIINEYLNENPKYLRYKNKVVSGVVKVLSIKK